MKNIVLSIQPIHFNKIASGIKTYEFRKVLPENIDRIYFYVSSPTKKVLAYIDLPHVLRLEKEQLWQITKLNAGIDKVFFDEYFAQKSIAIAINVEKLVILPIPLNLADLDINYSPQNFAYVKKDI